MAFRKKATAILAYQPDILVVQECEQLEKIKPESWETPPTDCYWYGQNPHKGIAVFTFNDYRMDRASIEHNPDFQYLIPLTISHGRCAGLSFHLFAVWTQVNENGRYTWQIYRGAEHYQREIRNKSTIIIGDLNSNTIWDKPHRPTNHSHLVRLLAEWGVYSAYHALSHESPGKESTPTLYFYRHKEKPYHIDYCFVSEDILHQINQFEIGNYTDFIHLSDHMPIMADVTLEKTENDKIICRPTP